MNGQSRTQTLRSGGEWGMGTRARDGVSSESEPTMAEDGGRCQLECRDPPEGDGLTLWLHFFQV